MEIKILDSIDSTAYNSLALHPMQSYEWGEMRKETGLRVVRFGTYENGVLGAVFQMTVHKLPKVPFFIGYIPRSGIPSRDVVTYIHAWAKKQKIIFVKWEPYVRADEGEALMASLPHIRLSPHPLFTEWNQEVDLSGTEEEIFARFHKNTRYSIRHAEKVGVQVKEVSTDEGFAIFLDLYFSTVARQKYHGHGRRFHTLIWKFLSEAGIARIFVAYYNGAPHAAFEVFFFHNRAYYPYSGSASTDRNIPATQLLMWHVIQTAKKEGMEVLDLWGSLPEEHSKTHPWRGFTLFKKGFGGSFVKMTRTHDQIVSPVLYVLYSIVYALRKLFWSVGSI